MTSETLALGRLLAGDPGWAQGGPWSPSALATRAGEHGVAALVWEVLGGVSSDEARAIRSDLTAVVRAAATRDLILQRDLQALLAAFAAQGVRVLVFKGTALAYTAYDEPWHRPRTDTDVLVARQDIEAAERVLATCGYVRSDAVSTGTLVSHQLAFERRDRHGIHHVIDLHWKIVNPQMLADALVFEELWRGRVAAPALSPDASVPSAAASAVIANVHRLAHHQRHDRLIWLVDLQRLTARFSATDWSALVTLACRARVAGLCLDGLRQSRDRLAAHLPADVERALAAAAPDEPSVVYLSRAVTRRDVLAHDLAALGWRARLRLLREHAFPPAAFIRQRYGPANRWPLPALYLHRLVSGAMRWVRQ
jgi:hypothetical protein